MAHKDIRILFEIEGRCYEAVGFLAEGELSTNGDEMLRRASAENGGAIKGEDEAFLRKRRAKIPRELDPYWLVTDVRDPGDPRDVSCFVWESDRWYQSWNSLDDDWDDRCLVLRRCA